MNDASVEADIPLVLEIDDRTEELNHLNQQLVRLLRDASTRNFIAKDNRIRSLEEQIETLNTENELLVHQLERRERFDKTYFLLCIMPTVFCLLE